MFKAELGAISYFDSSESTDIVSLFPPPSVFGKIQEDEFVICERDLEMWSEDFIYLPSSPPSLLTIKKKNKVTTYLKQPTHRTPNKRILPSVTSEQVLDGSARASIQHAATKVTDGSIRLLGVRPFCLLRLSIPLLSSPAYGFRETFFQIFVLRNSAPVLRISGR